MRLAFIAATAQAECRVQQRRRRRRHDQRKCLILQTFLSSSITRNNVHYSPSDLLENLSRLSDVIRLPASEKPLTKIRHRNFAYHLSPNSVSDSIESLSQRGKIVHSSTAYRRQPWPFVALWHLGSLILLLTTLVLASSSASSSTRTNMDEEKFWTPSTEIDFTDAGVDDDASELILFDDESVASPSDSCDRFDYFLSPISLASSSASNIVRRSVDETPSPFYAAAPNPAIDNVFAIWLRASRHGDDRASPSDHESANEDDSETSWPLQRPRTRHRYQHYRNLHDARQSTRKWPASTSPSVPRPRTFKAPIARIRASLATQAPSPRGTAKKKPVAFPFYLRKQSTKKFPQCKIFDQSCIEELCSLDVAKRVEELRNVYVKTNMAQREAWNDSSGNTNSSTITSNVTLFEFFALDVQKDWQLARPSVSHLADGLRPCVISDPIRAKNSSSQCRSCYRRVLTRLKKIDSQHEAFSQSVLSMIDCEPDNDLERFSPTSNCSECKLWYKRWLLVIFSDIWRQKPCLQWCHLAELACPHLQPVRKHDYAGLPSFRCTDPEISLLSSDNSTYGPPCDCVHPCDTEAYTKHWRWNIVGDYETREFCRDYQKRNECPAKKSSKKPSIQPSTKAPSKTKAPSFNTKGGFRASTTRAPTGHASRLRLQHGPLWLLLLCTRMFIRVYDR